MGADVDGEYGGEGDEGVGREHRLNLGKLVGQAAHELGHEAGIRHYGGRGGIERRVQRATWCVGGRELGMESLDL